MGISLLPAKLYRPRLSAQAVPRARLLQRLDDALGVRLLLLSAPAGFGKTTLAAEWLARRAPPPDGAGGAPPPPFTPPALDGNRPTPAPPLHAAWLTLDSSDNDPFRFWYYVAGALHAQHAPGLDDALEPLLARLASSNPPALERAVEELLHALERAHGPLVLVLDDYQEIQTQAVHDSFYCFARHLPQNVHLLLLTRLDPPLPLHRWHLDGSLLELRARDLCFSVDEAGAMLSRRAKIVLPQETVGALVEHTDGWPAGLQLVAASLQGCSAGEIDSLLAGFTGSNHFVIGYLMEEVLQNRPQPVRDFLLRTSILNRFCAPLCDELMAVAPPVAGSIAAAGAAVTLDYLEGCNLFLVPLDDEHRWYRYYHLFAEALREEMARSDPMLANALHRRAAQWYAAHGCIVEAIDHAVLAEDWEQAADYLEEHAGEALLRGDFGALYRWTDALPMELIEARPRLAQARGWLLLLRGPLPEAQALVEKLVSTVGKVGLEDQGQRLSLPGQPVALRAMLAAFRWNVRQALELCAEAERLLPPDDHFSRATVGQAAGIAHLMAGDYGEAVTRFQQVVGTTQQVGSSHMAIFPTVRLAQAHLRQGYLRTAAQIYRRLIQDMLDRGGARWPLMADGLIGTAELLREQNELLAAEHYVRRGLALAPARNFEVWAWGRVVQAQISLALGRRDDSRLQLLDAIQQAAQYDNAHLAALLQAHQARLDLASGNLDAVRQWARSYPGAWNEDGYLPVVEELTLARFYLADHRPRAAHALLDRWQACAEAAACLRSVIEIDVLQSIALEALGQHHAALATLQRALELAEPEGFQRIFLDERTRISPLLESLACVSRHAERLRATLAEGGHDPAALALNVPLDKLTPRELEILRALARGSSNQEIADTFVLTVGTVKGHVNHILSKLDARNRTEAVARGREVGLL